MTNVCYALLAVLTHAYYREMLASVNFYGMVRCCKAFLPILQDQATQRKHIGARIINLISLAGLSALPGGASAYAASKHAAITFSDSLRTELRAFRIQVSTVNPSFHDTPIIPHVQTLKPILWKSLPQETREKYGEGVYF